MLCSLTLLSLALMIVFIVHLSYFILDSIDTHSHTVIQSYDHTFTHSHIHISILTKDSIAKANRDEKKPAIGNYLSIRSTQTYQLEFTSTGESLYYGRF